MPSSAANLTMVFNEVPLLGDDGYVGCEYPARTEDGLGWFAPYRRGIA